MTQAHLIQTELDKASALLNAASSLLNHGRIVNITSLNGIIANICDLIKEEGYSHCQTFKPVLIRLSEQIDQIRIIMENQLENNGIPPDIKG